MKLLLFFALYFKMCSCGIPLVVNTWNFPAAAQKAWSVLTNNLTSSDNALDALTLGCKTCEDEQCGFSVGYGGNPDENGETTLDALIFDGDTMDAGAVGGLRRVKNVISVARHVLDYSEHSLLVGDLASEYAQTFNFLDESLQTNYSLGLWENWKLSNCQPNFWKNVVPDPKTSCGPYNLSTIALQSSNSDAGSKYIDADNHDTIGMIVISGTGHIVAGTSTNGLRFKLPGRVGDSPIPGAGAYADSNYGAACATGNGDIMMRFSPSFLAVEQLRLGYSPTQAAVTAISRIADKYPSFSGAIIVVDKEGNVGAACNGMTSFPFVVANAEYPDSVLNYINCTLDNNSNTLAVHSIQLYISVILLVVNYSEVILKIV